MDWVTADTHFGDKGIIGYENRPFQTVLDMDERIIEEWNVRVDFTHDRVFVLGDFSFYEKEETAKIVERLNGRKVLVIGNHDKDRTHKWWLDVGFEQVIEFPIIYNQYMILSHEPVYLNPRMPYMNVHGHLHSNRLEYRGYYNAGVELHGYAPVRMDEVIHTARESILK